MRARAATPQGKADCTNRSLACPALAPHVAIVLHHGVKLAEGQTVTADLVRQTATEELDKIREQVGDDFFYSEGRPVGKDRGS